jgi:elongation factor P--(R)-beta-lysine ligase
MLVLRHRLLQQVRAFFDQRGFLEVCTPLLSQETFADRYLEPFRVEASPSPGAKSPPRYLQTSPELAMKRIVAAGATAIYQVTQAFRMEERGAFHNPEFTILEWYCTDHNYETGRTFLIEFLGAMIPGIRSRREVTYEELFRDHTGVDPHRGELARLREKCSAFGLKTVEERGDMLDALMATCVEPALDRAELLVIRDFPEHQAALAQMAQIPGSGHRVAQRFEAYFGGMELANGYFELTDGTEFENRHLANCQARIRQGREPFPVPARFAETMHHGYPASVGVALGFDRLVMAVAGVDSIDSVQPFPFENA